MNGAENMYKVIKFFCDLQDNNCPYEIGDEFPRKGVSVTDERLKELSGNKNKQGCPLIELVKETNEKKAGKKAAKK